MTVGGLHFIILLYKIARNINDSVTNNESWYGEIALVTSTSLPILHWWDVMALEWQGNFLPLHCRHHCLLHMRWVDGNNQSSTFGYGHFHQDEINNRNLHHSWLCSHSLLPKLITCTFSASGLPKLWINCILLLLQYY